MNKSSICSEVEEEQEQEAFSSCSRQCCRRCARSLRECTAICATLNMYAVLYAHHTQHLPANIHKTCAFDNKQASKRATQEQPETKPNFSSLNTRSRRRRLLAYTFQSSMQTRDHTQFKFDEFLVQFSEQTKMKMKKKKKKK